MKTTIEMWHKVWPEPGTFVRASAEDLEKFAARVLAEQPAQPAREPLDSIEALGWAPKNNIKEQP